MKAIIFANGDLRTPWNIKEILASAELIIAADGGERHCKTLGVKPDVLIGDFDSLEETEVKRLEGKGIKIIRHTIRKDATDLELAMQYAVEQGTDEITIFGAIGDRFDHTIANVLLTTHSKFSNCTVKFLNREEEISLLKEGINIINGRKGDIVSLIPLSDVSDITTEGLEYPLNNENLLWGTTRGVSNVVVGTPTSIKIRQGTVLCVIRHSSNIS